MNGAELIYKERNRQLREEGWTPEHDAGHADGELSRAAECYVVAAQTAMIRDDAARYHTVHKGGPGGRWPWSQDWWKPSNDPIRNLIKAGALIAAEIDRLQRASATKQEAKESEFGYLIGKSKHGR